MFLVLAWAETAHAFTITRISGSVLYRDAGAGLVGAYEGYHLTNNDGVAYADLWAASESFVGGATVHLASNEDGLVHIGPMAAGASTTVFFYLISDAENLTSQAHTIRVYIPGSPAVTVASQSFSISSSETIQASSNKVTVVAYTPSGPGIGGTLEIQVTGSSGTIGGTKTMSFTPAAASTWRPDAFELQRVSIALSGGNTGTIADQLSFVPTNSTDTDSSSAIRRIVSPIRCAQEMTSNFAVRAFWD